MVSSTPLRFSDHRNFLGNSLLTTSAWSLILHMVAWVAELVDARDLKSLEACPREGSSPSLGTNENKGLSHVLKTRS